MRGPFTLAAHGRSNNGNAGAGERTTHTNTFTTHTRAHPAIALCLSGPFAISVCSLFPFHPRVPCIEALPAIFIQKQRRGRGRNCNVVEGRGNQIPVAKSRTIKVQHKRGRETCRRTPHLPRGRVRGLGKGLHTEPGSRLSERTTAQQQRRLVWQLPIPFWSPGVRPFAPPGPLEAALGGRLWRPYSCISFAHVRVLQMGKGKHRDAPPAISEDISCESSGRISL
ncbi:hypothetical protein BDP55DRAFT_159099 [Colletotrichum godetiae]|uniref:Uncharacterized protein n=1 Tax=Colletotrichum godetiae TaxID=1209918 RepID=A0AAJ0ANX5_9PEZI|nr:uncharacterized protein BDP55DRAFT_159099 [Colletotrichum godetiae]KAK1675151.1 hypothetical protein BDP55DRAFT_159099 [Colletotrichum godetiae]